MPVHSLAGRPSPTVADSSGMPSGEGRSQPNRRRYRRILAPIHCRPAGVEFFAQHLAPINISLGGLRIHSDEQFRVGASLSLDILFARIASATFTTEIMTFDSVGSWACLDERQRRAGLRKESVKYDRQL
jgi:hypothetical protein